MSRPERMLEAVLWNARFVVLAAVAGSLLASLAMFFVATVDTFLMIGALARYPDPALEEAARRALHDATVKHVVEIIDGYLLAAVLLIFGLGLYELFVSRIEAGRAAETGRSVLLIRDLDDLKNRLGKVILMILVVTFFERMVLIQLRDARDLLFFGAGVALVAAALWLAHASQDRRRAGDDVARPRAQE